VSLENGRSITVALRHAEVSVAPGIDSPISRAAQGDDVTVARRLTLIRS
jgi:hypothetical protein